MSLYGGLAEIVFNTVRPFLKKKYTEGNDQRWGYFPDNLPQGALWIHAVSVGEVQSAYPFVKSISAAEPSLPILLSTITQTGRKMSSQLLEGMNVNRIYYPWDAPSVLNRTLDTLRPRGYVTIETEIWPGMLEQLEKRKIPAFLVNGRLSEKSLEKYQRLGNFWKKVIRRYTLIMTRTEDDRRRFITLGADPSKVTVTGDCKVDAILERRQSTDLAPVKKILGPEPFIMAGSTHTGEDEVVIKVFLRLKKKYPHLRLVITPRHPERAVDVAEMARMAGCKKVCLTSDRKNGWNVMIVDRIGVLFQLYGLAEAVFMGGSLVPKGGQNIMEPAIWGVPSCQGPHYRDFLRATQLLTSAGLCTITPDGESMFRFFDGILSDGAAGKYRLASQKFFEKNSGASSHSAEYVISALRNQTIAV